MVGRSTGSLDSIVDTMSDSAQEPDQFSQVIDEATEILLKFSIPLYVHDRGGRPDQVGTGFFVERDREFFLISAAHVLDDAMKSKMFFYSAPSSIRYLSGRVTRSRTKTTRADDLVDIGCPSLSDSCFLCLREWVPRLA